jgi:hypothetical protein
MARPCELVRHRGFAGLAWSQQCDGWIVGEVFAEIGKGAALYHPCILYINMREKQG